MKFKNFQTVMAAGALIGLTSQAQAQDDLSLQALFDLTSSVASKMEQPIQDAPGIVTVYTQKDLRRLGYWNLADLANITPGYSSYSLFGERVFETRGQKAGSFNNNKHLVLVDGIPVNHVKANKAPSENELPLAFAKRVEFLKGPASALYGVGAFYGVINIVPEEMDKEGTKTDAFYSMANLDNEQRFMANATGKNASGVYRLNAGYYTKDASQSTVRNKWWSGDKIVSKSDTGWDADAVNNHKFWDDQKSTFMSASHKFTDGALQGLGLGIIYTNKQGGLGDFWMGPHSSEYNELEWESIIPYIKFNKDLTSELSLNSFVKATRSTEKGFVGGWNGFSENGGLWNGGNIVTIAVDDSTGDTTITSSKGSFASSLYDHKVQNYEANLEFGYKVRETGNLTLGFNFDSRQYLGGENGSVAYYVLTDSLNQDGDNGTRQKFSPFYFNAPDNIQTRPALTLSTYAQYADRLPVLEGMLLTAGVRFDRGSYDDQSFQQLSPRAALVQKITPELNFKLLYGSALRAPNVKEYQINAEASRTLKGTGTGVPEIEAETINSFETGLTFVNSNIVSSLSGFYNITTNPLDGIQVEYKDAGGVTKNVNAFGNKDGEIKAYGVEADVQYAFTADNRIFVNGSYSKATDDDDNTLVDVPVAKVAGGASALIPYINLNSTGVVRYIDEYRGGLKFPNTDGYMIIDMYFTRALTSNLDLTFKVDNLLEEDAYLPWLGWGVTEHTPMPGRTLTFGVNAKF
jgi:outer membrane receptor for ferrienterochelin and colicins